MSTLMAVKVLGLLGLGVAFVWWQMRDLARQRNLTAEHDAKMGIEKTEKK